MSNQQLNTYGNTYRHRGLPRPFALTDFCSCSRTWCSAGSCGRGCRTSRKLEVYECGEPTIGSSFVQFDLRFYVVALLFIIFDVEVAFFFPWAAVFGKATQLAADPPAAIDRSDLGNATVAASNRSSLRELGVPATCR